MAKYLVVVVCVLGHVVLPVYAASISYNGVTYWEVSSMLTWDAANLMCNPNLAVFDNADSYSAVINWLRGFKAPGYTAWIGVHKAENAASPRTVNGRLLTFSNLLETSGNLTGRQCGRLVLHPGEQLMYYSTWLLGDCTEQLPYLCMSQPDPRPPTPPAVTEEVTPLTTAVVLPPDTTVVSPTVTRGMSPPVIGGAVAAAAVLIMVVIVLTVSVCVRRKAKDNKVTDRTRRSHEPQRHEQEAPHGSRWDERYIPRADYHEYAEIAEPGAPSEHNYERLRSSIKLNTPIDTWLQTRGIKKVIAKKLRRHGIVTLQNLQDMSHADMVEAGLNVGDRNRIKRALKDATTSRF